MTSSIFPAKNVPKRGALERNLREFFKFVFLDRAIPINKICLIVENHVKADSISSSVLSSGLIDQSGFKKDQLADYFTFDGLLIFHH
ncbi:hypothetical protein BpHYR1_002365 [Brachionus plicatilis]|uniref:Uncharacterized protein n=1 Tax=Brachionus plicatilis TaxID=10195 RepID=A0A3M7QJQ1_BRAPC|nr:hypothetical protein BpHYR1_002365 [Brachionus plicatilis]